MNSDTQRKRKRWTASAPPGFMRMNDLCARIGFRPATVYSWIRSRGFPAPNKLSRTVALFEVAKVDAWMAAHGLLPAAAQEAAA